MPPTDTGSRTALLTLQDDVARPRISTDDRFSILTSAMLDLDDRVVTDRDRIDQRLSHIETDVAEVKTDLAEVKTNVDRIWSLAERLPKMDGRLEYLAGLIARDEQQGKPQSN